MRLGHRWKKLALVLLMAAAANGLAAAAPAHVFAAIPLWSASAHSHHDCCPPAPQCDSSCVVMSHCPLMVAALPASFQQAGAARPRVKRATFQYLIPPDDALAVEAPPPR